MGAKPLYSPLEKAPKKSDFIPINPYGLNKP